MVKPVSAIIAIACVCTTSQALNAGQSRRETSGGTSVVSPSVVASSSLRLDPDGLFTIDILILWRGSPGWQLRRTGMGGSMSGGSPARDGTVSVSLREGGLQLDARFDPASQTATIVGERVVLNGANVIFVDRVDAPDGPVVTGTMTVQPSQGSGNSLQVDLAATLRNTPKLLEYLRCEAQVSESLNRPSMRSVCAEAILAGLVKAPRTVTPVPSGPVTNRAAAVAPPTRPEAPTGAGQSSGDGVVSPAVVAGWFTSRDSAGAAWLDLLVLWRGSAGWMLRGEESGGTSGGGLMGSRRGMTVRRGGLSLYVAIEPGSRIAQIGDEMIPLGDNNVILVDDVDSARGPRVAKTLGVDPTLAESRRIDPVMARSPELVAYLRCDLKVPDARQQAMMHLICARLTGK